MVETDAMSLLEVVSLISGLASIILAVVAVTLSIVFFQMSSAENKEVKASSDKISASVDRLEKIFDTLYSDTFSIVRETVTDMREHIYRRVGDDITDEDAGSEEEPDSLTESILQKVDAALAGQARTDANIANLTERLRPVLERSIEETRSERQEAEKQDPVLRMRRVLMPIIYSRTRSGRTITAADLVERFSSYGVEEGQVVDRLFELARRGFITWDGAPNELSLSESIRPVPREERADRSSEGA
jgi:hypothetical protein